MPTFIEEEDNKQPEPTLRLAPERYDGQVVDVRKEGYDSLATFYSGSKVPGTYYQKAEGTDTAAASYQPDIPLIYGQRRRINNFEMIFQGGVAHKQNTTDSMGFGSTAEAVVYGVITPQSGDIFIAQIGARTAMLQINVPERLTPFEESGFTVQVKVQQWMDQKIENELNRSVVDEVWFSRENFRNGIKCLLTRKDLDVMKRLSTAHRRLIGSYIREFFDDRYMTIMRPTPGGLPTYDPNVTRFFKKLVSVGDFPAIARIVELGVGDDLWASTPSLFDAIIQRDEAVLYSAAHKWQLTGIGHFFAHPLMHSIYYSGVKQVMTPVDPKFTVNTQNATPYVGVGQAKADVLSKDIDYILPNLGVDENAKLPAQRYIKQVLSDEFYVFSKAFYEDTDGKSMLESMVLARLRNEIINVDDLADLADYATQFNNLERYYYIPIIINLIMRAPGVL